MSTARKRIGVFLLVTGAVAGVYLLIHFFGKRAQEGLPPPTPVIIHFTDIQCDVPAGSDRTAFLQEVRYLGGFGDEINIRDAKIRDDLRTAFQKHRDVAQSDAIEWAEGEPVRVRLRFKPKP